MGFLVNDLSDQGVEKFYKISDSAVVGGRGDPSFSWRILLELLSLLDPILELVREALILYFNSGQSTIVCNFQNVLHNCNFCAVEVCVWIVHSPTASTVQEVRDFSVSSLETYVRSGLAWWTGRALQTTFAWFPTFTWAPSGALVNPAAANTHIVSHVTLRHKL